jgi:hypothetical protein
VTVRSVATLAELPVAERNGILLEGVEEGAFDFIDVGSHKGGGLRLGATLGGNHGLGVEIDERKARSGLQQGLAIYTSDAAALPWDRRVFRFGVCRHVLEHLPDEATVRGVLRRLADICSDFIYVEGPDFSSATYLRDLGLTLAHDTMSTHTCRMDPASLGSALAAVGTRRLLMGRALPIRDSHSRWIHRHDAPRDRGAWREEEDLPKPTVTFDRELYRDIVLLGALSDEADLEGISAKLPRISFTDVRDAV